MRLFGPGSVSTPARILIEVLLVLIGLYLGLEVLLFTTLLVNPMHPMREYFQVTSFAAVPFGAWDPRGLGPEAAGGRRHQRGVRRDGKLRLRDADGMPLRHLDPDPHSR